MPKKEPDLSEVPGFAWRVSLSIVIAIGWLIFLVIWLFFYAGGYNLYQNIAIITVTLVIMGSIEGLIWKPLWWEIGKPMLVRRMAFTIVVGAVILVFAFVWLFFYAGAYTLYQNIAIAAIVLGFWSLVQPLGWRPSAREKPETKRRTAFNAVVNFAWAIFLFAWFYYYAFAYTLLENVIVFFVSAAVMGAIQGVSRTPWRMEAEQPGYRWRVVLSIVMAVGWFVFLLLWLLFFTGGYTIYQNMAIVLVSLLIVAAVLGVAWAPWGIKYARKYKKK
nr:hypothetical protein [Candidatus Njordarchaeum guaymaensis]